MLYVYTFFDKSHDGRPLLTCVHDEDSSLTKFYTLYIHKSGKSIYDIEKSQESVKKIIGASKKVVLNDYKQHIIGFSIDQYNNKVYDLPLPKMTADSVKGAKKKAVKIIAAMKKTKPQIWHNVRANAAVAYADLQQRGIVIGYRDIKYPQWDIDTYSGRSRASKVSVQGMTDHDIYNVRGGEIYLHFDWVSADIRMVSILSRDERLNKAFKDSDPYTYMTEQLHRHVDRDEAKRSLLASIYKMDYNSIAMDFYSGLKEWVMESSDSLTRTGHVQSVLGRKFKLEGDRNRRSVFNATIQGSVAHAMQLCIRRVWDLFPSNLLIENHDSLVLTCHNEEEIVPIVNGVCGVMVQPFKSIIPKGMMFPTVVSIGKQYRNWQKFKRFNSIEELDEWKKKTQARAKKKKVREFKKRRTLKKKILEKQEQRKPEEPVNKVPVVARPARPISGNKSSESFDLSSFSQSKASPKTAPKPEQGFNRSVWGLDGQEA